MRGRGTGGTRPEIAQRPGARPPTVLASISRMRRASCVGCSAICLGLSIQRRRTPRATPPRAHLLSRSASVPGAQMSHTAPAPPYLQGGRGHVRQCLERWRAVRASSFSAFALEHTPEPVGHFGPPLPILSARLSTRGFTSRQQPWPLPPPPTPRRPNTPTIPTSCPPVPVRQDVAAPHQRPGLAGKALTEGRKAREGQNMGQGQNR